MKLRLLNEDGLEAFRDFLRNARAGGLKRAVPEALLTSSLTSREIPSAPTLESFPERTNGFQVAQYLSEAFQGTDPSLIEGESGIGNPGFWGAVALIYFDLLTPGYRTKGDPPLAENCYIPESGTSVAALRYFRHRLAGPYRLFKRYGKWSEPFLLSPPAEHSKLYTTLTDSAFYSQTQCLVEVIYRLYFDPTNRRLRRGWNAKDAPGTLPRLLALVNQLDLTFDLLGMSSEVLMEQLPSEFDSWTKLTFAGE